MLSGFWCLKTLLSQLDKQSMYWMAGPSCTEYRGSGVQPTMTYVGSTQTTSPGDMGMPLSCSTGTRKNYPRKMVFMNAAQVEEQAQQWISPGIWSWSLKKEDLLSNKDNKQRFIRMLGQSLEHFGCETRHAQGDADVLIVETTVQSAMSCETTLVCDDTDPLCFCVFMSRKILVKSSSNQRSGPEQRRAHDAGNQVCAKSAGSLQQYVVCSCHPRLWYNFLDIQHGKRTRS